MKFSCPACSAKYAIADAKLGDRVARITCQKCKTRLRLRLGPEGPEVTAEVGKAASLVPASTRTPPPPAAARPGPKRAPSRPSTAAPPLKEILVFEADAAFAGDLVDGFAQRQCRAIVVEDARLGPEHEVAAARPDLVLVATELRGTNGFAVCNKLKRDPTLRGVPVVVLGGAGSEELFDQHRRLRTRADDYILKPIGFEQLVQRVEPLLGLDAGAARGAGGVEDRCASCGAPLGADADPAAAPSDAVLCRQCRDLLVGPGTVFVCHRTDDSPWAAGRIRDLIERCFGTEPIFEGASPTPEGVDFATFAREAVPTSRLMVVIIGERWSTGSASGRSPLRDPDDPVRTRIVGALDASIALVPVLIGEATLPPAEELPAELRPLLALSAVRVRPEPHFGADVRQLIARIGSAVGARSTTSAE